MPNVARNLQLRLPMEMELIALINCLSEVETDGNPMPQRNLLKKLMKLR